MSTPHSQALAYSKVVTDYNAKIYQINMNKNYILILFLTLYLDYTPVYSIVVLKYSFYCYLINLNIIVSYYF